MSSILLIGGPSISQGVAHIQSAQQEVNSGADKTEAIATSSFRDRMLTPRRSFRALTGREFSIFSKDHVDQWVVSLLTGIAGGLISSVKEQLAYLSHLSPENQIAVLSTAKDLAKNIIDTMPDSIANDDNVPLSIFTLIDEKLQECHKSNPNLSLTFPIDTRKEKNSRQS